MDGFLVLLTSGLLLLTAGLAHHHGRVGVLMEKTL